MRIRANRQWSLTLLVMACVCATLAGAAHGSIRPADQRTAVRLTPRLTDFVTGWKIDRAGTTKLRQSLCSAAPDLYASETGYSMSPLFEDISTGNQIIAATRVWSSATVARSWFAWAAGAKDASCDEQAQFAGDRKLRYQISNVALSLESFIVVPLCGLSRCFDSLRAWRLSYTASKGTDVEQGIYDMAIFRVGRTTVDFEYFGDGIGGSDLEYVAQQVLGRVTAVDLHK